MILLTLFLLLATLSEAKLCAYSCDSRYPTLYGPRNLAPGAFGLPSFRTTGFSPASEAQLCADDQKYDFATLPLPTLSSSGRSTSTDNFVAVCQGPSERGLKFFSTAENSFSELSLTEIPGEGEILGFSESQGLVLVLTEDSLFHYSVEDGATGEVKLVTEYDYEGTSGTFVPFYTGTHAVFAYDQTVFAAPLDGSGEFLLIETGFLPVNGYAVVVSTDIVVFMTLNGLVKVDLSSESVESISQADGEIVALAATSEDSLLVAATGEGKTFLSEVNSETFDEFNVFGDYDFVADGMSRAAYKLYGTGPVALISLTTDKGVVVVAQQYGDLYPKGTIYAHYDTAYALSGKPTITRLGEPVVFGSESVIAFTESHTVKFFATETDHTYLPSPVMLGADKTIGITSEGTAVLFSKCERFLVGEEEPEGACPIADLPVEEEVAWWMTMVAGAAAVVAVPVAGEYACMKMKVCGSEEDDGEEKPRRRRNRKSESAQSVVLTPMRKQ